MQISNSALKGAFHCSSFDNLALGDSRISDRLKQVVNRIQAAPAKSFPAIFGEEKELDAFYRLMNNPRMSTEVLGQAVHLEAFRAVSKSCDDTVLALHDTTEFSFSSLSELQELGRISGAEKRGFFGHFCLGVQVLDRKVLGVLGLHTWSREQKTLGPRLRSEVQEDLENEGLRWAKLVKEVELQCPPNKKLIHVADREADSYSNLSQFVEAGLQFVVRVKHDRKIEDSKHQKLFDSLKTAEFRCQREVYLQARKHKGKLPLRQKKDFPERRSRKAELGISAKTIDICRGSNAKKDITPDLLKLNFVRVSEIRPPEGETPVEWMLITSEPIETEADLTRIVDIYRARWVIEEYFKALKTGCSFEKRGFETIEALIQCLWIFASIACQIYNLKTLGRSQPSYKASNILTLNQIQILSQYTRQSPEHFQTIGTVMLAVAKMGGHLKRNGPPGWQTLARGYEKLIALEEGWLLAQSGTLQ